MIRRCIFLLVLLLAPLSALIAQGAYVKTPELVYFGLKVKVNSAIDNCQFCEYQQGGVWHKARPNEVLEYYNGDAIYRSKKVPLGADSVLVFLKTLSEGEYSLFHYKNTETEFYLVVVDSTDYYLPSVHTMGDQYKAVLHQLPVQPYRAVTYDHLKYNSNALKRYVRDLNTRSESPFPRIRYGFALASVWHFMHPQLMSDLPLEIVGVDHLMGASLGAFINIPVKASQWSSQTAVDLAKITDFRRSVTSSLDIDLKMDVLYFDVNQMLRYTFPARTVHPYVEMGAVLSLKVDDGSLLRSSFNQDDVITVFHPYQPVLFGSTLVGGACNLGLDYGFSSCDLGLSLHCKLLHAVDKDYYNRALFALNFHICF